MAANAQLYFDSLTNNAGLQWSLNGPAGTVLPNLSVPGDPVHNRAFSSTLTGSDANMSDPALLLPAGGPYTLLVDATGQTTGAYGFRLSDLATAPPLTPGTAVSGALNPANSTNFYQFNVATGQSFYFARLSGSGGSADAWWRLIDPYGNVLFSTFLSDDVARKTLTAAGTYTLLIEGGVADTGTDSYSFNVAPIRDTTQALTLGSAVNASLAAPGELDHYTFDLAANALLLLRPTDEQYRVSMVPERPRRASP